MQILGSFWKIFEVFVMFLGGFLNFTLYKAHKLTSYRLK